MAGCAAAGVARLMWVPQFPCFMALTTRRMADSQMAMPQRVTSLMAPSQMTASLMATRQMAAPPARFTR